MATKFQDDLDQDCNENYKKLIPLILFCALYGSLIIIGIILWSYHQYEIKQIASKGNKDVKGQYKFVDNFIQKLKEKDRQNRESGVQITQRKGQDPNNIDHESSEMMSNLDNSRITFNQHQSPRQKLPSQDLFGNKYRLQSNNNQQLLNHELQEDLLYKDAYQRFSSSVKRGSSNKISTSSNQPI
ncbi:UNKNOWN [Stylonychia lemnae]|uniref:Transmembrane protein n=1 Tax=Stylonychia lemnae TaxID=5949 RepID=A0A078B2E4_STYLE|nr:UNKNOWN [Stylonychia lemnae]|eukprot:CDW87387.1 UNKNOWN [Stylonychia lemnae]